MSKWYPGLGTKQWSTQSALFPFCIKGNIGIGTSSYTAGLEGGTPGF